MKNQNPNRKMFESYDTFELRAIGRSVGVHLPSKLRNSELIDQILLILEGKSQPYIRKTKRGRPAKENLVNTSQTLLGGSKNPFDEWLPGYNRYDFSSAQLRSKQSELFFMTAQDESDCHIEGLIELTPENYGFVRSNGLELVKDEQDARISGALIEEYNLRYGDYITCRAKTSVGDKKLCVYKVESVNGKPLIKERSCAFDVLEAVPPQETIEFGNADGDLKVLDKNTPILKGQRVIVSGESQTLKSKLLDKLAAASFKLGFKTFLIKLDQRPEDKKEIGSNVISAFCGFDLPAKLQLRTLELAINNAKRIAEARKDVVFILDGLLQFMRLSNLLVSPSGKSLLAGIDYEVMSLVKKLFALGKAAKAGSITLICSFDLYPKDEGARTVLKELAHMSNSLIMLDKTADNKIKLDATNSYTS